MLIARIGVGVGEAGVVPTGNALVADYFPSEKSSSVLAIFTAGGALGITVGLAFGGWAAEHFGWRWAFFLAAAPGLPLAILVRVFLQEPGRGASDPGRPVLTRAGEKAPVETTADVVRELFVNRAYLHAIVGAGFVAFLIFGVTNWMPAYIVRRFDLPLSYVGTIFGLSIGLGSSCGAVLGGFCANHLTRRDVRWLAWIPLATCLVSFPLYELAVFADSANKAFLWGFLVNAIGGARLLDRLWR